MRILLRGLVVVVVFAWVVGQAVAAPSSGSERPTTVKVKDDLLHFLDDLQSFVPWMPNESNFADSLARAHEQLQASDERELAPLREFSPHLAHLRETVSRMRGRLKSVQSPAELCDPARSGDLFLLLLDTVDADGQRGVTGKICRKLAHDGPRESLAQACAACDLAYAAAKSMHDLVLWCDPALEHGNGEEASDRFDQLRSDIAGVKAGVQDSVHSAQRDLTQAMGVVAGHVSEVSTVNTGIVQDSIQVSRDYAIRLEIEKAVESGKPYAAVYLPEMFGGRLELVRTIVNAALENVNASGEGVEGASAKLAAGDEQFRAGHYKKAFRLYSDAYRAAVGSREP